MVTKQQAMAHDEFHYGKCTRTVGPRGGVKVHQVVWRRNGATKVWKTRPEEFRVPVKYGLYDYGYVDNDNAHMFHVDDDCPLNTENANA